MVWVWSRTFDRPYKIFPTKDGVGGFGLYMACTFDLISYLGWCRCEGLVGVVCMWRAPLTLFPA